MTLYYIILYHVISCYIICDYIYIYILCTYIYIYVYTYRIAQLGWRYLPGDFPVRAEEKPEVKAVL